MESLEAMDKIDRLFLTIDQSIWLPQWSFDFWVIPYLIGKGLTFDSFDSFMRQAHRMLALEIASVPDRQKQTIQSQCMDAMVQGARSWWTRRTRNEQTWKHSGALDQS